MPSYWKAASHIFIAVGIVAATAAQPVRAMPGFTTGGVSAGSVAAAARAAIGNVAQHVKAVPDQVNSLGSKYAPMVTEADMKHYTAKKDEPVRHINQLPGQPGAIIDKVASENAGIEKNLHTAQDVVSQHIKGLTGQVCSIAGKYDLGDEHILADPRVKVAVMIAGGTVIGAIAVPATVALLGFSTAGVVAGSTAAVIQAGIGNVAAGSAFAIMQSVGTVPLLSGTIGATVGAAAGGTAAVICNS